MSGVCAFVPARSGSKRLPDKNVRPLAGKPLVLWTLEACARAEHVSEVIFSTDSDDYWELANRHFEAAGLTTPLTLDRRNPQEAGDQVKIFDYLRDGCDKIFGQREGDFMLALPTAPLRSAAHIDEAAALRRERKQAVFSATEYSFAISFAFTCDEDGGWSPVFADSPMRTGNTRSQNQAAAYHPNGAIYIRAIDDLRSPGLKTLYEGAIPFLMASEDSVDIDTLTDFFVAEGVLRARGAS